MASLYTYTSAVTWYLTKRWDVWHLPPLSFETRFCYGALSAIELQILVPLHPVAEMRGAASMPSGLLLEIGIPGPLLLVLFPKTEK